MKTLTFLGSKEIGYQCLAHLLHQQEALDCRVIGVLTNPTAVLAGGGSMQQLCEEHGITIYEDLEAWLDTPDCDILISVQYHKILKKKHIQKAREIAVNLHMAPLPELRGCNQFSIAIIEQMPVFGTTIHRLDPGIDAGPILFESRFPIPEGIYVQDLYEMTFDASVSLFQDQLGDLVQGNYTLTSQEDLIATRGTAYHYREEINKLKQIDLNWDKAKIERYYRATYFPPYEPPYTLVNGEKIYITPEHFS